MSDEDIDGTGLTGDYYDNNDFTSFVMSRIDPSVDFNWGQGSPDPSIGVDTFTVQWTGQVRAEHSETYTFYTYTDDGARLWVDDQLLVDKWVEQGGTEWSGTIDLVAGQKYNIVMEYLEASGGAEAVLRWQCASQAKEVIPQEQLFSTLDTGMPGIGLTGDYYNNSDFTSFVLTRTDATVDFLSWGNGSPDPSIGVDTFSVLWTGQVEAEYSETYTFYTYTDDGARLTVNDQLLVDKLVNQGGTEWSGTIALTAGQKYNIVMEYFENDGGAEAALSWSSASQLKEIIPQSQLHPTLGVDTTAPTPNPATFASAPAADSSSAISMTATTGSDPSGPVEYLFTETTSGPGATSSSWQTSASYTDSGLNASTQYTYTVQMRDSASTPNVGTASSGANATTQATPDTTAPTPNPATFASAPSADSDTAISMTATTGSDASGPVEYLFTETSGNPGATSSSWQTSASYTDSGLNASTQYTYTVQMRDSASTPNVGTASSGANATTQATPDTTAPTPNPATFASAPSADSDTAISMTATTGSDASGPVEYLFTCTAGGGNSSSWQTSTSYTDSGLTASTQYTYTVQMRDALSNTGTASAGASATTQATPDTDAPTPNAATFASAPSADSDTAISMTATTGTDATGPVEYLFTETSGNPGATSSSWQTSTSYTDSGLNASTQYTYTVQMRDSASTPNVGTASSGANATTQATPDTTAPTPNAATFASAPSADSDTAISMTATTGSDASGPVEYYFDETSGNPGGTDSSWQTSTSYTDSGLNASTQYTYTVQMRDSASTPNVGTASSGASATTDAPPAVPVAPSSLSLTAISTTEIDLSWTDNASDETGFKIERSKRVNTAYSQVATVGANVTSYSDTGLKKNTTYYYRVRATNANGDSAYCTEQSVKTPG